MSFVADRRTTLLAQAVPSDVVGIDFVYVHPSQKVLDLFVLGDPSALKVPMADPIGGPPALGKVPLAAGQILIASPGGGESVPVVPVTQVLGWIQVDNRWVLRVTTDFPGDFSRYRLRVDDPRVDRYFNDVPFSFKANCPSDFDCAPSAHECATEPAVDFPVDYSARDFWSLRQALLDFATQRYPAWEDRLEADLGMAITELLAALGDEFMYDKDRIARELHFETASQRRSIRRHARLVDYALYEGQGATTWLDVEVQPAQAGAIPAGTPVWERDPPGEAKPGQPVRRAVFELGHGLASTGAVFAVSAARNTFAPHVLDDDALCLPAGSTELLIDGWVKNRFLPDAAIDPTGKWVLLKTSPADASLPARAHLVKVLFAQVQQLMDPLSAVPQVTRLVWDRAQATPFELDLASLAVRANLVPASAGETKAVRRYRIGPLEPADAGVEEAIERAGHDGTRAYLYGVPDSDLEDVVFLREAGGALKPEVRLESSLDPNFAVKDPWDWRPGFLDVYPSLPSSRHFILDDGLWRRLAGYRSAEGEFVHRDYAGAQGRTIRFGDGEFGLSPAAKTYFRLTYRLGRGARDNVARDTLRAFPAAALPFVAGVTNPLPAEDGRDAEPALRIRERAPEAFRAITFRAVKPADYAEALERLPFVQRAGAAFRWTGSWLTAFATPDPRGAFRLSRPQRLDARRQLERFRQAGREAKLLDPVFANLDLRIVVCVAPTAYRAEVEARVMQALFGTRGLHPRAGFFDPDHFTFGTPLSRASLEAAIQAVAGVRAVESIRIRRRGWFGWRAFAELVFRAGHDEVLRVANDRAFPERGTLGLSMDGGA